MSDFHFLRPFWLLALIPLAYTAWRLFRLGRGGGDWRLVCDAALLPHVLSENGLGQSGRRIGPYLLGGLLAILALAGPAWERLPTPVFRNQAALVIALDLSRIMQAADLKPSRLERARFKIADILTQRKDGLTALLVYSGDAFTITPLTDDSATIHSQLSALTTDLMPAQGSRADLALELAGRLLQQAGLTHGDILLMTNGVELGKASAAARKLNAQGYRVSVLGTGNEEGAPVPLPDGGFLQDTQGNIIVSRLAAPALRQLAKEGGGEYRKMATDNSDLADLLDFFGQQSHGLEQGADGDKIKASQWQDRGPWLLWPLLPLAALAFRRGCLALLILAIAPMSRPAQALEWRDWWQTRDQQANQAFQSGDPARAAQLFANPEWKAASEYKAGDYAEAAKTLQGLEGADARYNLGNALAKQGRYRDAVAAYDQALRLNPGHADARHNKELVEQAMQAQQKQQQQSDQSGDGRGQNQNQRQSEQQQERNLRQGQEQQAKPSGKPEPKQPPQSQPDHQDSQGDRQEGEHSAQPEPSRQDASRQGEQASAMRQADQAKPPESAKPAEIDARPRGSEDQQANEQWLRRIPDDPGGLLRRKFLYQYRQRQNQQRMTP